MTTNRFDEIAKLFANRRLSRRQALATGGAGLAAGIAATGASTAQEASPAATPEVRAAPAGSGAATLFVQSFRNGSIAPRADDPTRHTVTLREGLGQTIHFTDRPERTVGATPTEKFLKALGFLPDNPPNAALVIETVTGETDIAVVELFNPIYDPAGPGVTYDIAVLDNWQNSLELGFTEQPALLETIGPDFGAAHLFIDDCPDGDIQCYNGSTYEGPITNAEHGGYCYNGYDAACYPCPTSNDFGDSLVYWSSQCNRKWPRCNGACRAKNLCITGFNCPQADQIR